MAEDFQCSKCRDRATMGMYTCPYCGAKNAYSYSKDTRQQKKNVKKTGSKGCLVTLSIISIISVLLFWIA